MKKHLLPVFALFAIAAFLFCSYSCRFSTGGTWKDDHIDDDLRNQINALNKKLMQNIKAGDVAAVKKMMSQPLLDSATNVIDTLVHNTSQALTGDGFNIIDEFYVKNTADGVTNTLFSNRGNIKDYKISFVAINKESYTSLIVPQTANESGVILISYGKYNSDWKINMLYLGERKLLGKTAPEYYQLAKVSYQHGDLIDAVDQMAIAKALARPVKDYFRYMAEDSMKNLLQKAVADCKTVYHFPITVNISTKPQIFQELPQVADVGTPQGIFPIIRYKSNIPIKDTTALKVEKDNIQKVIGTIFKGIDTYNDYIIYQACDKIPANAQETIHRYGFLEKQK